MVNPDEDRDAVGRHVAYMAGWRCGSRGGAYTDGQMANADFKAGHDAGRKAQAEAYAEATRRTGVRPSILR